MPRQKGNYEIYFLDLASLWRFLLGQIEVHTSTIHLLDLVGAEMSADVKVKKRSHKDKVCLVRLAPDFQQLNVALSFSNVT